MADPVNTSPEEISLIVGKADWYANVDARAGLAHYLADSWPAIRAALAAPAQCAPGVVEISCEVDLLDDIEVDADGKCKWTDVANAQTHIRAVLHRFLPSPVTSTERPMVVGRTTGKLHEGDQVPGMPGAICHACGRGYKCFNPDCPNVRPDPAFPRPVGNAVGNTEDGAS